MPDSDYLDFDLINLQNGQDKLATQVNQTQSAIMSALTLGAGKTVNVGFRLFLGILANLPVTLAFGCVFFVIFFWWSWWTRRRFARNWWLDTCLKFIFCHFWPVTIFIFGFLAFKDLSQTRFVEERPRPDDVAKSLQASLETMIPYWLGVIANTGTDPALTAAVTFFP